MEIRVDHIKSESKFRIFFNENDAGYLTYMISNGTLDIQHTVVRPQFRGQGLGKVLVDHAIDYAKEGGLTIIPSCSYAERIIGSTV